MAKARRASVAMLYNKKSTDEAARYFGGFTYTDVASGSSDSISVQFNDPDRRWIDAWFPQKGDRLEPTVLFEDWEGDGDTKTMKCGAFVVDDFSFVGGPIRVTLNAVAMPSTSGFKATERTNTYEKTTLKEIGEKIAVRAGLELFFEPSDKVSIESVTQDKQTDCTFFNDLVTKYGYALKVYNDKLVVFDEATYEGKATVATLHEDDFETGWKYNTTLAGTYTGITYSYTAGKKNKTYSVDIGDVKSGRVLFCDDSSNNLYEATLIAVAKINNANKGTTTIQATLKGTWRIRATDCVKIEGIGKLDGKYFVEKSSLTVNSTGGTKTNLSLRLVEKRFEKAPPAIQQEPVKQSSSSKEKKKQQQKQQQAAKTTATKAAKFVTHEKKVGTGTAAPIVKGEKVTSITKPLSGNVVPKAADKKILTPLEAVLAAQKEIEARVQRAKYLSTAPKAAKLPTTADKKVGVGTATIPAAKRPTALDPSTKKVGTGTASVPTAKTTTTTTAAATTAAKRPVSHAKKVGTGTATVTTKKTTTTATTTAKIKTAQNTTKASAGTKITNLRTNSTK